MSSTNAFVWLTGTVTIPSDAPASWQTEGILDFYRAPNDPRWGGALCRVLYHESIHFWQLLSSGYLANAVQDEWLRLVQFEQTGEVPPASRLVEHMYERQPNEPFAVIELVECWARYWDVHTRSPARTVQEESIDVPPSMRLFRGADEVSEYTSDAFDLFMQRGRDAELYAAPYRWLLEQCEGNTLFANLVFPALAFHALGTRSPVAMFQSSLRQALQSPLVRQGVVQCTRSINFDWLNNWSVLIGEAVEPARQELGLAAFTGGWDVIDRGRLRAHPIYNAYLRRLDGMFRSLHALEVPRPAEHTLDAMYEYALRDLPSKDPLALFALPGQPTYRLTLAEYLPPPRIRFRNFAIHAEGIAEAGPAFETLCNDLDRRVQKFREAEYAVSIGLPADAFRSEQPIDA